MRANVQTPMRRAFTKCLSTPMLVRFMVFNLIRPVTARAGKSNSVKPRSRCSTLYVRSPSASPKSLHYIDLNWIEIHKIRQNIIDCFFTFSLNDQLLDNESLALIWYPPSFYWNWPKIWFWWICKFKIVINFMCGRISSSITNAWYCILIVCAFQWNICCG